MCQLGLVFPAQDYPVESCAPPTPFHPEKRVVRTTGLRELSCCNCRQNPSHMMMWLGWVRLVVWDLLTLPGWSLLGYLPACNNTFLLDNARGGVEVLHWPELQQQAVVIGTVQPVGYHCHDRLQKQTVAVQMVWLLSTMACQAVVQQVMQCGGAAASCPFTNNMIVSSHLSSRQQQHCGLHLQPGMAHGVDLHVEC